MVFGEPGTVLVVSQDAKRLDWSNPPRSESVVEVVAGDVRHVGRVSGVIDAADDGQPGDLTEYRPSYRDQICVCGCGESFAPRRADQRYANDAHRERAKKRRQRAGRTEEDNP